MAIFPDVKQAKPFPYEKVFRLALEQIESNYKDGWLYIKCREQNLLEIYNSSQQRGIFNALKSPSKKATSWPPRLTIELVPSTCWFENVRSNVSPDQWTFLKKSTYKRANYKCEICGGKGPNWPVECHEIWDYDDNTCVQTLVGLIALCPPCHEVKHIGFTQLRGKEAEAKVHLALINKWNLETANNYIKSSFDLWSKRSKKQWSLELSFLKSFGIEVSAIESEPIVEEMLKDFEQPLSHQHETPQVTAKLPTKKQSFIKAFWCRLWSFKPLKYSVLTYMTFKVIGVFFVLYAIGINELCEDSFTSKWAKPIGEYCRTSKLVIKKKLGIKSKTVSLKGK